jgi:hypothetical protein
MEWAILLKEPEDLNRLEAFGTFQQISQVESDGEDPLSPYRRLFYQQVSKYFGPLVFTRVYFGNEFCQHLIPSLGKLRRVYEACKERGIHFSFVTPYVTDKGIKRLRPLLDFLAESTPHTEVIVNDWGVLRMLRRNYPELEIVLGRLMNKMLRDPRVTGLYKQTAPETVIKTLNEPAMAATLYQQFLTGLGVRTLEFDVLLQGMNFSSLADGGLTVSVYVPYGFVATGRVCMIGSLHLPKPKKFDVDIRCSFECQEYTTELHYTSPVNKVDQKYFQKGTTVFYTHSREMLASTFEEALQGRIHRIIYQPGLM